MWYNYVPWLVVSIWVLKTTVGETPVPIYPFYLKDFNRKIHYNNEMELLVDTVKYCPVGSFQ